MSIHRIALRRVAATERRGQLAIVTLKVASSATSVTAASATSHFVSWSMRAYCNRTARNVCHYQDADLALQATVLAHGIAEGQQFIDGNKRMALIAMLAFLEINGWRVEASDAELDDWILSFSQDATPEAVAELVSSAMQRMALCSRAA